MERHADSHLDHALTEAQIAFLLATFADRGEFFIASIELPPELGTVPCALFGPTMGDAPIADHETYQAKRGTRTYNSRLVNRDARPTRTVTIIAGPHDGRPCVLYTAFGGPASPKEPGDLKAQKDAIEAERIKLSDLSDEHKVLTVKRDVLRVELADSRAFWSEHALAQVR